MISLPIPDPSSPAAFGDLIVGNEPLGPLVESLTKGKISRKMRAHLDPDLEPGMLPRQPGWRAIFGQTGAAAGHLKTRGVGMGDLFLYFGWFREAEKLKGRWHFQKNAPDLHILFGWLQVGEVVPLDASVHVLPEWMQEHPHCHGDRGPNNTLYIAKKCLDLTLPESMGEACPGSGVFGRYHSNLVLTRPGETRCHWALPAWFHPEGRPTVLSYHDKPKRWQRVGNRTHLHSVARGQEFVLDLEDYPEALPWLRSLFAIAAPCSMAADQV